MAKTEYIFLSGKAKWVKSQIPNKFGDYSFVLYPDDASYDKILALKDGPSGVKNVIKKDEEGYNVTFKRPQSKLIAGKVKGFTPPEILDGSKTLDDGSHPPLRDILVGNGSDVTVKIEVYSYTSPITKQVGRATRWVSMRIDNLIPFQTRRDFDTDQADQISGLSDQPVPLF